ncbi:MAG: YbjQ family protein [Planctomycetota bacterium]|jgi:uncharacterized protein YbjQ (UPF0145 family)
MKTLRNVGSLAFVLGLFVTIFAGVPWHVFFVDDPVALPLWLQIAICSVLGGILVVLLTVALEQKMSGIPTEVPQAPEPDGTVTVLNSAEIPGRKTREILGVVQGHTVFVTEYTEMMGRARTTATNRMIAQAAELGADAIINVRYMTTSVVGSAAELLAYGTAVKLGK